VRHNINTNDIRAGLTPYAGRRGLGNLERGAMGTMHDLLADGQLLN